MSRVYRYGFIKTAALLSLLFAMFLYAIVPRELSLYIVNNIAIIKLIRYTIAPSQAVYNADQTCIEAEAEAEAEAVHKCEGLFEYIPGMIHKSLDYNVPPPILPLADDPVSHNSVIQCYNEWGELRNTVGNHQFPKSTHGEDVTIWKNYFGGSTSSGFFLELGAFDGVTESNTRFFERCLGWNGVLMEANPTPFKKLRQSRPRAAKLLLSPTCNNETTISFNPSEFTNAKTASIRAGHGKETPKSISVHCGPMHAYLAALDITHIDFMSLDVEGSELAVLKTIDFDKVTIKVLMVESKNEYNKGGDSPENTAVCVLLAKNGYRQEPRGTVRSSDVYIHY